MYSMEYTDMSNSKGNTSLSELISRANKLVKLDQYENAIELYLEILDNNPDQVVALKGIGGLYLKTGQIGKSIEYLSKAVKLKPNDSDLQDKLQAAVKELEEKPKLEWPIR
jgi:tetratricopeptide (TPR) repeat protein